MLAARDPSGGSDTAPNHHEMIIDYFTDDVNARWHAIALLRSAKIGFDQVVGVDIDSILFTRNGNAYTAWLEADQKAGKVTVATEPGFRICYGSAAEHGPIVAVPAPVSIAA